MHTASTGLRPSWQPAGTSRGPLSQPGKAGRRGGQRDHPAAARAGPGQAGPLPAPATPVSDALDFKIIDFRSISKTIFDEAGIPVSRNNSCVNYSFSWIVSNLIIKIILRAGPGWCLGSREPPSTFPTGTYSLSGGGALGAHVPLWGGRSDPAGWTGRAGEGPCTQLARCRTASQSGGGHKAVLLSIVAHRQQSEAGRKKRSHIRR